eukprot:CAMPEP_0195100610 /NCGR_PEP_ID=MMETSP0448-20130528/64076_1 /TAXON_ID=66468 /ORGANISM="Heterocapsa triquestra, Strain CCMP 448" /LENGTH=163 /DNA_ID=CAMNT_0040135799 /DNA_START=74 /DNA_END=561 /DNA_ORIENTATION=-
MAMEPFGKRRRLNGKQQLEQEANGLGPEGSQQQPEPANVIIASPVGSRAGSGRSGGAAGAIAADAVQAAAPRGVLAGGAGAGAMRGGGRLARAGAEVPAGRARGQVQGAGQLLRGLLRGPREQGRLALRQRWARHWQDLLRAGGGQCLASTSSRNGLRGGELH